jgi:hypothetical protein
MTLTLPGDLGGYSVSFAAKPVAGKRKAARFRPE